MLGALLASSMVLMQAGVQGGYIYIKIYLYFNFRVNPRHKQ